MSTVFSTCMSYCKTGYLFVLL